MKCIEETDGVVSQEAAVLMLTGLIRIRVFLFFDFSMYGRTCVIEWCVHTHVEVFGKYVCFRNFWIC